MQLSDKLSAALGACATPRRHRQLHTSHSQTEISRLNSNRSQKNKPISQTTTEAPRPPRTKHQPHQGPSAVLRASQQPQPRTPTHYEPSDSVPGRLPLRRASSGRFWHGFAVRLAACMDADRRCNSRLCWTTDAEEMHSDSNNDFERLLSPEEVARACGLSRRAVYRAIARGELRAARLCHRLRVQPAELERWVGEQTLTPAPPTSGRVTRSMRSVRRGSLRAMLDGVGEREADGER
jgi:excisionase family DNA binding protein